MKKATKLRVLGGAIILFLLWLIGRFNVSGMITVALLIGFAIGYELLIVGPHVKGRGNN